MSAGSQVACGVTASGVAKCWGHTLLLGSGATAPAAAVTPHTVLLP